MKQYRKRKKGTYYVIEVSSDGGKSWTYIDSDPTAEGAQAKLDNLNKGLQPNGLTNEEAKAKASETSGPSIGPADPNNKSVITRAEAQKMGVNVGALPSLYELEHPVMSGSKATDEKGYIDNDGNVHLNSRATEARTKASEEDLAEGRNFRDAKAPSANEVAQKTAEQEGDYGKIGEDGKPVFSDLALQQALEHPSSTQAQKDAIRAEITRRDEENKKTAGLTWADISKGKSGEEIANYLNNTPGYKPGPKTMEGMAALGYELKDGKWVSKVAEEALKEIDKLPEEDPTADESNKLEALLAKTEDGEEKNTATDKKAIDKAQQLKNFLNNNPTMLKAIFGKSGLNFGERAARLGELLATLGANTVNGIYAGVNKTSFTPVQGKWQKYYQKSLDAQQERENKQLSAAQSGSLEQEERWSMLKNGSTYFGDNPEFADKVATYLGADTIEKNKFYQKFDKYMTDWSDEDKKGAYDDYVSLHDQYMKGLEAQGKVLGNESVKLSNENQKTLNKFLTYEKTLSTQKECQEYINSLYSQITELEKLKIDTAKVTIDQYWNSATNYMNMVKGIQTSTTQANQQSTHDAGAATKVRGGIPVISGSVDGHYNYNNVKGSSAGTQVDELAKQGLMDSKTFASADRNKLQTYANELNTRIDEQIEMLRQAIDSASTMQKKLPTINDGIVKPKKYMNQWILREDGTKIKLNPKDYIYATKNKITTKGDDGSNVVPMEKEDKAVVLQKKLGYKGGNIDKDCSKYIKKLGGSC